MDSCSGFRPKGSTYAIAAAASAPTPIPVAGPANGDVGHMVYNSGTVPALLAYAPTDPADRARRREGFHVVRRSVLPGGRVVRLHCLHHARRGRIAIGRLTHP